MVHMGWYGDSLFPVRAGMSRLMTCSLASRTDVPRVSGDEPEHDARFYFASDNSSCERG